MELVRFVMRKLGNRNVECEYCFFHADKIPKLKIWAIKKIASKLAS